MMNIPLVNFQNEFSEILSGLEKGEEVVVSSPETQKVLAVIVPYETWQKIRPRALGTLQHRGSVEFTDDFKMTDEELLQS